MIATYEGPVGQAPDVGLGALAEVARCIYGTGALIHGHSPVTDECLVQQFGAFLAGIARRPAPPDRQAVPDGA